MKPRTFDSKYASESEGLMEQSRQLDLSDWHSRHVEEAATTGLVSGSEALRIAAIAEARRRQLPFMKRRDAAELTDDPRDRDWYVETYGEEPPR